MIEQIFFSIQVKQARLLVMNCYIRAASQIAKQLKTFDLRIRKSQENLKTL